MIEQQHKIKEEVIAMEENKNPLASNQIEEINVLLNELKNETRKFVRTNTKEF